MRTCIACDRKGVNSSLVPNEELGYMECETGLHIEPINLTGRLWWNQCPACKGMGLNSQKYEAVDIKNIKGKPVELVRKPLPYTCKHCGIEFTKK